MPFAFIAAIAEANKIKIDEYKGYLPLLMILIGHSAGVIMELELKVEI